MKIIATERDALLAILDRFRHQPVVMLGDLVADESIYGEIARVSREAPVLILKQREKQVAPGGGANAANNLADLGARVIPVGVVGDDEAGAALLLLLQVLELVTPPPSLALEIATLTAANAVATVVRFLLLRMLLFHLREATAQ